MANTPFLDLVKPAGTDKALVSVINSNSDKIDTGVSTLSDQIGQFQGIEIPANTDLNNLRTDGNYYSANSTRSATLSNTPVTGSGFALVVQNMGANTTQMIKTGSALFLRGTSGGSTWGDWRQYAEKSEVEKKLDVVSCGNVSSSNPMTITTSNNGKYLVVLISASGRSGLYSITVNSSGSITIVTFFSASSITMADDGANKLKITSSSASSASTYIMCFNGTASV